ncbi:MAG: peptidase M28, partial [Acidobacteriota bacterium]
NFAKIGVPAVSVRHGRHFKGHDIAWGEKQWQEYRDTRYHRPSDEYRPDWNLEGAEQTGKIVFYLAYRVAMADGMPSWNEGDEFAPARRKALDQARAASRP